MAASLSTDKHASITSPVAADGLNGAQMANGHMHYLVNGLELVVATGIGASGMGKDQRHQRASSNSQPVLP